MHKTCSPDMYQLRVHTAGASFFFVLLGLLLLGFALRLIIITIPAIPRQHSNETDRDSHLYNTTASKSHAVNEQVILQQSKTWVADDGLKVLVLGGKNTGKTTLIKGLFEKNENGLKFARNQLEDQSKVIKSLKLNGVPIFVTIMNLPLNPSEKLEDYHLIMYTIKATEPRYRPQDSIAIAELKEHGAGITNKTVFVLTYAGEVADVDKGKLQQSEEILIKTVSKWKKAVNETLNFKVKPEQFVLAGDPSEPELYGTHWPSEILAGIYYRLEGTQHHALARACDSYWIRSLQGNREPGNCAT